ncbi:hypothetical protein GQ457_11G029780 [Hibiscus cannabinus]
MANTSDQKTVGRRSANYHPSIWQYDYIQSLKSNYQEESFNEQATRLIEKVWMTLEKAMEPLEKLELIDTLQRLGLSYHFHNRIKRISEGIRSDRGECSWKKNNLYATALEFRLVSLMIPIFPTHSNIIYCSSLILRLADDLGTSDELKRGDVSKSIQLYMHETGSSEMEAHEYIRKLMDATWKKMNGEYLSMAHSTSSPTFVQIAMNLARMAQCMYQFGDGHGVADQETRRRVLTLLVSSICNFFYNFLRNSAIM